MTQYHLPLILALVPIQVDDGQNTDKHRAPKVKSLTPVIGAENVDPNLKEIRVVFDMPMSSGGYSFTGGGPTFPQPTAAPRWEDAYTCVLPVNLKPRQTYRFGINSPSNKNFRSVWLVPVEPVECWFSTGGSSSVRRSPERQQQLNLESYETFCEALRTRYAYFDLRAVDWEARFAEYRERVVKSGSDREWAQHVADMLSAANDLHLWLAFDGESIPTTLRDVAPNFSMEGVERQIGTLHRFGRHVATAQTDDGIVYILISSWSSEIGRDIQEMQAFLARHRDAPGMIIDVRPNAGGSETLAKQIAGWFVDEPKVYAKHAFRRGAAPDDFTPVRERVIQPNESQRRYTGPVAVLMGRANMSSCEAFLLMMKQAPRATLMGERSYGSSGNPKPNYLPNGVTVMIPSWRAMRPDGSTFEGEGIKPDIVVKSAEVRFETSDPVLAQALAELRGDRGVSHDE